MRFKHVFVDAEGTLYVPKNGRSRWEFWTDPSPESAVEFFELDEGVYDALVKLRSKAETLCIVSMNKEAILNALLEKFGIRHLFDEVLLNGDKGHRVEQYLEDHGYPKDCAIMVGDMPGLDLYPLRAVGVEAILVDRSYNRTARAERIKGISDLPTWLRMADIVEGSAPPRVRRMTLDDFMRLATGDTKTLIATPSA